MDGIFLLRRTVLLVLLFGVLSAMILPLTVAWAEPEVDLTRVLLPNAKSIKPFKLMDHLGKPFNQRRLQGKWTFLLFGYTHCPDVCPTALAVLANVFERLRTVSGILQETQGVFVSVDSARDTPELLNNYLPFFNPDFVGVTGSQIRIFNLTSQLGAAYMISPEEDDAGNYSVSHSADYFLINPAGMLVARFRPESQEQYYDAGRITAAYLQIRKQHEKYSF